MSSESRNRTSSQIAVRGVRDHRLTGAMAPSPWLPAKREIAQAGLVRLLELKERAHHPDGIRRRATGNRALGAGNDSLQPGGPKRAVDPDPEVVHEQSDAVIFRRRSFQTAHAGHRGGKADCARSWRDDRRKSAPQD